MKRVYVFSSIISLIIVGIGIGLYDHFDKKQIRTVKIEHLNALPAKNVDHDINGAEAKSVLDFTEVAEKVMPAVVHIRSIQSVQSNQNARNPFEDFFRDEPFRDFFFRREMPQQRDEPRIRMGQGSGVIISEDGYIVTNNHVIQNADDLEVTLYDNRTYKAMVIGTDPTTDLALIQIKEKGLSSLSFVNSDDVKVGEWVLAVGNPFNLTSTVTAGIVSAKGRNINILRDQFAIESFIQTDAAINPGNSGGALVNLQGGLIGINTAIASSTGTYAGYGFAVPTNIVNKVVEDFMEYGVVQRGVLGIMIRTVDGNLQKQEDLDVTLGAYVDSLFDRSAAKDAGIKTGDVIIGVNEHEIKSSPDLQEIIGRHRPGDILSVKVNRKGKELELDVELYNREGNIELVDYDNPKILQLLGVDFEEVSHSEAQKLDISGGIKVKNLYAGKLRKYTDMKEGYIITKVDGKSVKTVNELVQLLEEKSGGVMLEGVYSDMPGTYYYAFGM